MRALVAFAALGLGTAVVHADWYKPGQKLPAKPTIEIAAPTSHLGTRDRWCKWLRVTITDDSGYSFTQRMFGCEPPLAKTRKAQKELIQKLATFRHSSRRLIAWAIGHADFHFGAGDPDGADEQPHPIFLLGEDMLDA